MHGWETAGYIKVIVVVLTQTLLYCHCVLAPVLSVCPVATSAVDRHYHAQI